MSVTCRRSFHLDILHLSEAESHWWERTLVEVNESLVSLFHVELKRGEDLSCTLTLSSREDVPEGLLTLLQAFLHIYRPTAYLLIPFAVEFGPPILAYGGGTVFVCAHWIRWSSLSEWIGENVLRLQNYSNSAGAAFKKPSLVPLPK